jgi:hypothetical protein
MKMTFPLRTCLGLGLFAGAFSTGALAQDETAAGAPAAQAAPAAEQEADSTRWRYMTQSGEIGLFITDRPQGDAIRTVSTYAVLAEANSAGIDSFQTRFEANCETDTIKDLGGTAYAAGSARGAIPSRTNDQPVSVQPQTLYSLLFDYACNHRLPDDAGGLATGRSAAFEYARRRMHRGH